MPEVFSEAFRLNRRSVLYSLSIVAVGDVAAQRSGLSRCAAPERCGHTRGQVFRTWVVAWPALFRAWRRRSDSVRKSLATVECIDGLVFEHRRHMQSWCAHLVSEACTGNTFCSALRRLAWTVLHVSL